MAAFPAEQPSSLLIICRAPSKAADKEKRYKMKRFLKEFKEFALRGNVMDMAVGIIIGGAFSGNRGSWICISLSFFCCEFYHHGIYSVLSGESYQ